MPVTVYPPGLVLTELEFDVPLSYSDPGGEQITIFAREVATVGSSATSRGAAPDGSSVDTKLARARPERVPSAHA